MERSLTNIANYVAESGHEVTILNLFKTKVFFDLHPSIQLIWPSIDRARNHRLIYAVKLIPFIRRSLRRIQPDSVLSFGEWFNSYVLIATRGLNLPVFVSDRMGPDLYLGWMLEAARKLMYKYASGIIAQTNDAASKLYNKTGSDKITIIPNALRPVDVHGLTKKNRIVTVGRLSREKGQDVLIRAFAGMERKDWTLHIVGDGREMENLRLLAKDLSVEDSVFFYGHLKDFGHILGESKIFVLPSYYEGFPNALIEAMSVPLACISSNCVAGPADIIQHGINGLLFEPGNEEQLIDHLNLLSKDENLMAELSMEAINIRETLEFKKIARNYLNYILGDVQN